MSGLLNYVGRSRCCAAIRIGAMSFLARVFPPLAACADAQQARREPNSVSPRGATGCATAGCAIIITGLNGARRRFPRRMFSRRTRSLVLTGPNEEGSRVIVLPPADSTPKTDDLQGPREILFRPKKKSAGKVVDGMGCARRRRSAFRGAPRLAAVRRIRNARDDSNGWQTFYPAFINPFFLTRKELAVPPMKRETVGVS